MSKRRKRYNRYDFSWPEYVPVAKRKKLAEKEIAKLKKKGKEVNPIIIEGRNIANTFWGKAWCNNLEAYSDFDNRLPRGRTYVRTGSVLDLNIGKGEINALVNGSSIYKIAITIAPIRNNKWDAIVEQCSGKIDSLIELLQGKFSKSVMDIITHKENGLFPAPKEINFNCSCLDAASMCKHIAAVLYGIGARLDDNPEHLFLLRHTDHNDLIKVAEMTDKFTQNVSNRSKKTIADSDLSDLFGIDINEAVVKTKKTSNKIIVAKKVKSKAKKKLVGKQAKKILIKPILCQKL